MWPPLLRKIILPVHEALLHRPTFSVLRSLSAEAARSDADIRRYQTRQIEELLEYARSTSPYWAQRAGHETLPILTRTDVHRFRELMRSRRLPGKLIRHTSSGTTDDNLTFYLDRTRQAWSRALRMHALRRLGVEVGEKQLHFWPHFGAGGAFGWLKDAARALRDPITNDPSYDLRPISVSRLQAGLGLIDRYRPAVVIGYPSWLFMLAQERLKTRPERRSAAPQLVLSTGEVLYDFQRRAIESAFDAPVYEEYGSQEVGLIASEDINREWAINSQHVAIEVLHQGRTVQPGHMGEIVVTNLHSHVMPFIRYATGDVVISQGKDPCSPASRYMRRIEGRASDVLVDSENRLQPNRHVVDGLVNATGVTEFSLYQTTADRILCMTLHDGGFVGMEAKVVHFLRAMLGQRLKVDWKVGSTFRLLKSGKRRYICSPVAHALLAHDRDSGMSLSRAWPQLVAEPA